MIHYRLRLYAIRRSNSSNVFAENLPSFFHSKRLYWKKGVVLGHSFFLVQCCWSISAVWEVSGCHHWFYFLFSSSGARNALRENWWPLVSGSDVILWQAEAGGHCCRAEWVVKDALSAALCTLMLHSYIHVQPCQLARFMLQKMEPQLSW